MKRLLATLVAILCSSAHAGGIEASAEALSLSFAKGMNIASDIRVEYPVDTDSLAIGRARTENGALCSWVMIPNRKYTEDEKKLLPTEDIQSDWRIAFSECHVQSTKTWK